MILDQKEIVMSRAEWRWRTSQYPESLCQLRCFSPKYSIMRTVFMHFTLPSKRFC